MLDTDNCFAGHSFSECHVLTEVESLGQATVTALSERLVLEKSTVSRLVQGLVRRGELVMSSDPADGRRKLLRLSGKGRKTLDAIHRHSNAQVEEALAFLSDSEREQVVTGLGRYARALRYARVSADYRIRPVRKTDNPAVASVIRDVMTEHGAVGCGYSINDPEVDDMYRAYPGPAAAFFVIEKDGVVLGCGGMAALTDGEPGVCELRKMYFRPELRGKGLGARLLGLILETARNAGYQHCYLETLESMGQARKLYLQHGFLPIDAAMGNTGHSGCNSYMLRAL
ncbi:MAG: helix-turn-helix domain-containing GNAT family N-acetyltransferase [Pseudomonadota bacterium]